MRLDIDSKQVTSISHISKLMDVFRNYYYDKQKQPLDVTDEQFTIVPQLPVTIISEPPLWWPLWGRLEGNCHWSRRAGHGSSLQLDPL